MGEARRKKLSGESEYWYHGSNEHFVAWASPPVIPKYKPELHPHPFISLSKDLQLANGAGRISGGLCRAKFVDSAKVLDLRQKSDATEAHWRLLLREDLAKHHVLAQEFETWLKACSSGDILRLHTTDQELGGRLGRLQKMARSYLISEKERINAFQEVQNITRRWIDDVIEPARQLGYQAAICAEADRFREGPVKACLNLYVFDPAAISPPDWVTVPDEAMMLPHLEKLKALGFA